MIFSNEEMIEYLIRNGYLRSKRVIEAFKKVDRKKFVPEKYKDYAYFDEPLPIGEGQTISAPSIVALMTEELEVDKGMKVLEIGTGSGYQAAILSEIVGEDGLVVTVERFPSLLEKAKERLKDYKNIVFVLGDGTKGYKELAPYDRIIVTACAPYIPPPLIEQLKEGGIMIIPVGGLTLSQELLKIRKVNGNIEKRVITYVAFVPLIGEYGFY